LGEITKSLLEAIKLISSLDPEIYGIIGLTLAVTVLSTFISGILGISAGLALGTLNFPGRNLVARIIGTFMGLPPVVAGLIVYMLLSRSGPLGSLSLLFTPAAMVIAQVIIIFPVITGLTISAVRHGSGRIMETCRGLGFSRMKTLYFLIHECRYAVISAVLAGYGRAVSEVGAVMLVGGNIRYKTRVMTTAIVLETGMGEYRKALALGIILLVVSFMINWILQRFQEGK
jgi:tungstate transport system permease protein